MIKRKNTIHMKLYYFSSNIDKYEEINALLPFHVYYQKTNFTKEQTSLNEIVKKKLHQIRALYPYYTVLVDSCGLEIDGLHGLPGPYVKEFFEMGLPNVENIVQKVGRRATATCVMGLLLFNEITIFTDSCLGSIVEAKGDNGTGFDQVFQIYRDCWTLAEHTCSEKRVVSMRGSVVLQLLKYFEENNFTNLFV